MILKAMPIALVVSTSCIWGVGQARADDDAPSYTIADVRACSKDALRLCRDKLAHLGAIETCMKSKFDQLSPKCQTRFKDH